MGRWAWAADAFDFDNDGSPEIYIACGMLTNSSEQDLMSFFWRQVVANSPATRTAAPDYENGWNALDQWIREDYSWNGREPNVLYARRGGRFYDFSAFRGSTSQTTAARSLSLTLMAMEISTCCSKAAWGHRCVRCVMIGAAANQSRSHSPASNPTATASGLSWKCGTRAGLWHCTSLRGPATFPSTQKFCMSGWPILASRKKFGSNGPRDRCRSSKTCSLGFVTRLSKDLAI